jgi:hypothetical protein
MTVHEANCQLKYDVWTSGAAANDGLAGAGYNATGTAAKNVTLKSGVTANKSTAVGDYVSVPHGPAINNQTVATWEILFRWDAAGANTTPVFFSKDDGGANDSFQGIECYYYSSKLYIERDTAVGSNGPYGWCAFTPVAGTWYDIQITWDMTGYSNTPVIIINNVAQSVTFEGTTVSWIDDSSYNLTIGNCNAYDSATYITLTLFRWHNAILSSAYLTDNYNADIARIYEANCQVKYDFSEASTTQTNDGIGAATYNGTADSNRQVVAPSGADYWNYSANAATLLTPHGTVIDNPTIATWEFIFYYNADTNASARLWDKSGTTGYFDIYVDTTNHRLYVSRTGSTSSRTSIWNTPSNSFPAAGYYHVIIAWNMIGYAITAPSIPLVYINNSTAQSMTNDGSSTRPTGWQADATYDAHIGNRSDAGYRLNQKLYLYRYHNTLLTPGDVALAQATEAWRYNSIIIAGPTISAGDAAVVGGTIDNQSGAVAGAVISAGPTAVVGGTVVYDTVKTGPTINAGDTAVVGGAGIINIIISGANITAASAIVGGAGSEVVSGAVISAGDTGIVGGTSLVGITKAGAIVLATVEVIGGTEYIVVPGAIIESAVEIVGGVISAAAGDVTISGAIINAGAEIVGGSIVYNVVKVGAVINAASDLIGGVILKGITISGAMITANVGIVGGTVVYDTTIQGPKIDAASAIFGGMVISNLVIVGPTISAVAAVLSGAISGDIQLVGSVINAGPTAVVGGTYNIIIPGAKVDAASAVVGGAFGSDTTIVGPNIDATSAILGGTVVKNIIIPGALIDCDAALAEGVYSTTVLGAVISITAEVIKGVPSIVISGAVVTADAAIVGGALNFLTFGAIINATAGVTGGDIGAIIDILIEANPIIAAVCDAVGGGIGTITPGSVINAGASIDGGILIYGPETNLDIINRIKGMQRQWDKRGRPISNPTPRVLTNNRRF